MPKPKKLCVLCNHPVGGGGNRHAKFSCPRRPGVYGEHRLNSRRKRVMTARKEAEATPRGEAVAGTGKPSASSSEGKKKKASAA